MKPWREIAPPNDDVHQGTFQQSEFAADINAVLNGRAPKVYQDARTFYERTFITEGMRILLGQVAERLSGRGGEPVIQLQTAFGGGKTHTLLAVYHLATRDCALVDLQGVPSLLQRVGLLEVPRARVAILEGNAHSPGQPWSHGAVAVRTLWGELAWQLGGADAYERVRQADETGTSPGKEVLRQILADAAPAVVLADELVAWVRQFEEKQQLSGGTFETNLSFLQALTEAVSQVPGAILLGSLPESNLEVGREQGRETLRALSKVFGRVQALWKPVAIEESFEIVRRRLFNPIRDEAGRDEVCAAFAKLYRDEGTRLPSEAREVGYQERLRRAYPIHPELFDRLYEDWSTLEGFQRTRGVLRLMARVIHRLWQDDNQDLMIMPGSLPLYDGGARHDLVDHVGAGWDAVIDSDIDGDRSEATALDNRESRFGAVIAARRVGRTLFLGSAPAAVSPRPGTTRGLERGRVLLGCVQPGQSPSVFGDALNRLCDRMHYLSVSGERDKDGTRFWMDTRANLRREMEDRKPRFKEQGEVRERIGKALDGVVASRGMFDGAHVFRSHSDVPDDQALRLVLLDPQHAYSKTDPKVAHDGMLDYLAHNGKNARYRQNRLIFLAADHGTLSRLRDAVRAALAWGSIVEDLDRKRLNVDMLQADQAKKELVTADQVVARIARECWCWLLCPVQQKAGDRDVQVEAFKLNPQSGSFGAELDRVCTDNELVIPVWSPVHLRGRLTDLYWKADRPAVRALTVWEDMARYLYLPRLKSRAVFESTVRTGSGSEDFFGTALGEADGRYQGFKLGEKVEQLDDTLLLIEPGAAAAWRAAQMKPPEPPPATSVDVEPALPKSVGQASPVSTTRTAPSVVTLPPSPRSATWFGSVDINATSAKMKLVEVADEIIALLAANPTASVRVTVEIEADFPNGVSDNTRRSVKENGNQLGFKRNEWE